MNTSTCSSQLTSNIAYNSPAYTQSNIAWTLPNYSAGNQDLGQSGHFYGLTSKELEQVLELVKNASCIEELFIKQDLEGIDESLKTRWFACLQELIKRAMSNEIERRQCEN